jgi:hypothetical protein
MLRSPHNRRRPVTLKLSVDDYGDGKKFFFSECAPAEYAGCRLQPDQDLITAGAESKTTRGGSSAFPFDRTFIAP